MIVMNITVYCGSNCGTDKSFAEAAAALGEWIAGNGHSMVYGGGNIGLMNICSDRVLKLGGKVTGVIPEFLLDHEHGHDGDYTLEVVPNMPTRKSRMIELGDAYIALPGGPGTIEEITEVISLRRLGRHDKPCILLNIGGYYDAIKSFYGRMPEYGFMDKEDLDNILFADSVELLDEALKKAGLL